MTKMPKKLYKYIGPEYIAKVFDLSDKITVKCSLPKDFNDPYELFLTIDFNRDPEELAYYSDAIGELPQLPTTCFSRSPLVIPMWAHYAHNHQGFVLEFSEDELIDTFSESRFEDVSYSDTPTNDFSELLAKAVHIGKPRYTYILQRAVFDAAYFTKTTCWSYEQERRMVVADSYVREAGPLVLLDVPRSCITNIICGSKASVETKAALTKLAKEINCGYFELRIGKSSAIPYLAHNDGQSFFFDGVEIVPSHQHCETCQEPAALVDEQCSWCRIDERLRQYVASRNPFRILDHIGLLGSYIESMDAISGGRPRRKSDD